MTEIQRPSLSDLYDSLTQVDDELTEQYVGVQPDEAYEAFVDPNTGLKETNTLVRVFEFVHLLRTGSAPQDAANQVRTLTRAELADRLAAFMNHEDEAVEDEPDTEAGKGDSGDE